MNELDILADNGIGVIPTDTLYGVVGSAFSQKAVEKIYSVKGRDENKPFIILISTIGDLEKFGIELLPGQTEFLNSVWPGAVSLILPCLKKEFEYLHRGTNSLAFRLPDDKNLLEFLKKTGPLVAPSSNPQGKVPAHTLGEAKKYFGDNVDFYIDGGEKNGQPSKIVSLLEAEPKIIRS